MDLILDLPNFILFPLKILLFQKNVVAEYFNLINIVISLKEDDINRGTWMAYMNLRKC